MRVRLGEYCIGLSYPNGYEISCANSGTQPNQSVPTCGHVLKPAIAHEIGARQMTEISLALPTEHLPRASKAVEAIDAPAYDSH